jgi:sugar phosphate isomerase/epimerase
MSIFDDSPRHRRVFLRDVAAMGMSASFVSPWTRHATIGATLSPVQTPLTVDRIGVQLYSVGDQLRQDFDGTLEKVAQIGYRVVEFAGYANKTPSEVRETLDRVGIRSPSTHIAMDALRRDLPAQIQGAQVIGHEYITIPSLGRSETPMNTVDAWRRIAGECNEMGAKVKAAGLKLAFHSHTGEFIDVGNGRKGMDVFIFETDPSVFNFQLDLGWARVASQDPTAWFKRYAGRFRMWHVKDFDHLSVAQARQLESFRNPPPPRGAPNPTAPAGQPGAPATQLGRPVPVGAGDIDFKPIFAAWADSGVEHFFVEQDGAAQWPGGSLTAIAASYSALRKLLA